jgi:hypothetical protein
MSIRTALILAMLGIVLLAGTILGIMEVTSIDRNVIREAQSHTEAGRSTSTSSSWMSFVSSGLERRRSTANRWERSLSF